VRYEGLGLPADFELRRAPGLGTRRIERARYEPIWQNVAMRRPSNRLVAATLEKRWNDAMQRVLELEVEFADFQRQAMRVLTPEQKQQTAARMGHPQRKLFEVAWPGIYGQRRS
jgi:hypothetical protein